MQSSRDIVIIAVTIGFGFAVHTISESIAKRAALEGGETRKMDLIHEALKKAQAEGRVAARSAQRTQQKPGKIRPESKQLENTAGLFLQRIDMTAHITDEVQKIVENIHAAALNIQAKLIGFTSALPQEGTTTLALASATLMADKLSAAGTRINRFHSGILLIDAQVRNPAIHTFYRDTHPHSLLDVLAGKVAFEKTLRKVENTNLSVLPLGSVHGDKWPQVYTAKFKKILAGARQYFDYIIIDLPSLLTYSEGISCSMLCDGIVFVVRAGKTTLAEIEEAKSRVLQADITILGSILNRQGTTIPKSLLKLL